MKPDQWKFNMQPNAYDDAYDMKLDEWNFNGSIDHQLVDRSIDTSIHRRIDTSIHRSIDTSIHRYIDTSTYRYIDRSTHRYIDTSTYRYIDRTIISTNSRKLYTLYRRILLPQAFETKKSRTFLDLSQSFRPSLDKWCGSLGRYTLRHLLLFLWRGIRKHTGRQWLLTGDVHILSGHLSGKESLLGTYRWFIPLSLLRRRTLNLEMAWLSFQGRQVAGLLQEPYLAEAQHMDVQCLVEKQLPMIGHWKEGRVSSISFEVITIFLISCI